MHSPERSAARQRALSRHLLHLCAAGRAIWRECRNAGAQKGEMQLVGLFADFIEDALAGEPVFGQVLDFAAELLLHPRLENGVFPADVVKSEKRNPGKRHRGAHQQQAQLCPDAAFAADVRGRGVWRGAAGRA